MTIRATVVTCLLLTAAATPAASQDAPASQADVLQCLDPARFARVDFASTGLNWKLYFRASNADKWYFVIMDPVGTPSEDGVNQFTAVLPRPEPSTARVYYRISETTPDAEDYDSADVLIGGCQGFQEAVAPEPPEVREPIIVHRADTGNEVALLPPGFAPTSVQAFEANSNTALIIGLAAAGAGAAAAGVLVSGGDTINITEPQQPPVACIEADPSVTFVNEVITFSATCSSGDQITLYEWDFGDGNTSNGPSPSVKHAYKRAGNYSARVRITNSAGATDFRIIEPPIVVTAPKPDACIETDPSLPTVSVGEAIRFDGSCSTAIKGEEGRDDITSYVWNFGDGTDEREGRAVSRAYPRPGVYGVRLTVTNRFDETDFEEILVQVTSSSSSTTDDTDAARRPLRVSVTSHLQVPPANGSVRANVAFNGQGATTVDNASPRRLDVRARAGRNMIEGIVLTAPSAEGRWRFVFNGEHRPVAGTLEVEQGQVLSRDASSIVFRLSGASGERIRFHFDLAAPR